MRWTENLKIQVRFLSFPLNIFTTFCNKEFPIGAVANKKWEIIKKEIDKCELLCSNCHRIEHSNMENELFLKEVKQYRGRLFDF